MGGLRVMAPFRPLVKNGKKVKSMSKAHRYAQLLPIAEANTNSGSCTYELQLLALVVHTAPYSRVKYIKNTKEKIFSIVFTHRPLQLIF